jgi:concanavalin A-like lectin/glucanase superfamily protein
MKKMKTLSIVVASILNIGVASIGAASQPYWEPVPLRSFYAEGVNWGLGNAVEVVNGYDIYGFDAGEFWIGFHHYNDCGGWESLDTFQKQDGTRCFINAVCTDGDDIYIAGDFQQILGPDLPAPLSVTNIVKFNTICRTFSGIGGGSPDRVVNSVAVDSTHTVYIGRTCTTNDGPGTTDLGLFQKWNGSSWVTVGGGLVIDPDPVLSYHAKWGVTALAADGTNIYAAGGFAGGYNTGGGDPIHSTNVIKWTGTSFSSMGDGGVREINVTSDNPFISSIAISGTNVFFAGWFYGPYGDTCNAPPIGIFRFSTTGVRLPCDSLFFQAQVEGGTQTAGSGYQVAAHNGTVYVTGNFDTVGTPCTSGITAHGIAQWSNGSWSPLVGPSGEGLSIDDHQPGYGAGVVVSDVAAYVFGHFFYAGGVTAGDDNALGIARFLTNPGAEPACPCHGYPGIVAWWPLEGNGNDVIGGNNGTLTSGNYSFSQGEVNQAIFTAAKPGGVTVPNNSSLNIPATTNFTIEAWVQPQSATTSYDVMSILEKRYTPDAFSAVGYELCLISGKLAVQISDSLNVYPLVVVADSTADLRDTYWHHVAVSVNRTCTDGGRLYVDGVRVATFDPSSEQGDLTNTQPLLIGMHPDPSLDCNFRGGIDEVTLYKRALTDDQIAAIFYTGTAGKTCN